MYVYSIANYYDARVVTKVLTRFIATSQWIRTRVSRATKDISVSSQLGSFI